MAVEAEPGRLSDGRHIDQEPQWPVASDGVVQLERTAELADRRFLWHHRKHSKERMKGAPRIAYRIRQTDQADEFTVIVPADASARCCHLTSVQTLFARLMPGGAHQPWQTELIYDATRAVTIQNMRPCNTAGRSLQWLALDC
jgi:hypothetical protein